MHWWQSVQYLRRDLSFSCLLVDEYQRRWEILSRKKCLLNLRVISIHLNFAFMFWKYCSSNVHICLFNFRVFFIEKFGFSSQAASAINRYFLNSLSAYCMQSMVVCLTKHSQRQKRSDLTSQCKAKTVLGLTSFASMENQRILGLLWIFLFPHGHLRRMLN
jgi:hypothetical protein